MKTNSTITDSSAGSFRPSSYWEEIDPLNTILRNTKGTNRRQMVTDFWNEGKLDELNAAYLNDNPDQKLQTFLESIDPSFMGGEYLPDKQAPSEMTDLDTEDPASAHQSLLLTNEKGNEIHNPPWQVVERIVRELNPGYFNSYACLSLPGNTYVQCLHGFNGWHVEWRITDPSGDYAHYRAGYPGGSSKAFELKKHDFVSKGEFRDLLHLDDVLDALRAFHQDQGLPGLLEWRRFDV
jgi:hypothetical protein